MNLRSRSKVQAEFNMSSMTDIIFLLLIFFMLTSTLVSPNALKLLLPNSSSQTRAKSNISVSIDKDQRYYFGTDAVTLEELRSRLQSRVNSEEDPTVVLNAEKSVPIEAVVQVMNIGNELKLKMILATNPKK
jgi:biopolymer transport protein ExbD